MKSLLLTILIFTLMSVKVHAQSADVFFGYSFADEFDQDGGDAESESALVLGVRYKDQMNKGFGWNVGLGLDTIRDLDGSSAEVGFLLAEANATLVIDQVHNALYVFAGLNYPLIIYEDKGLSDIDPVFGVQFGTGFEFTNEAGLELAFRTVNFELGSRDSNLWGFLVRGYYTFAGF